MHPLDFLKVNDEIDKNGWEILAIYHSHVGSRAYPSPTDVLMAKWPGTQMDMFPDAYYILISLKDRTAPLVRAFTIHGGKVGRQRIEAEPH
jgi:proteasome lid subunit RPN8/RPN11